MKNILTRTLTTLIMLLALTCSLQAQGDTGDGDGQTADVPVDGGISLLLAAGAGWGISRLKHEKNGS
jgi:hypothetical protein